MHSLQQAVALWRVAHLANKCNFMNQRVAEVWTKQGEIEFSLYGMARGIVELTFKLRFCLGKLDIINQQD